MADDTSVHEGGCLCGKIRYQFSGDPLATAICHCKHCQRQGGSAFSIVTVVPDTAYAQQGESKVYVDTGDSGHPVYRHFCGNCGSPVISLVTAMPGVTIIKAGTLDDASWLQPTQEVYCCNAIPAVPHFAGTTRIEGAS